MLRQFATLIPSVFDTDPYDGQNSSADKACLAGRYGSSFKRHNDVRRAYLGHRRSVFQGFWTLLQLARGTSTRSPFTPSQKPWKLRSYESVSKTLGIVCISFAVSTIAINSIVAGEADVVKVKVTQQSNGSYSFQVTVRHNDEGWDHYADAWEVIEEVGGADGTRYSTRVLAHPHENEQPFTRGKSGVRVPEGVKSVIVRAHDKVHGYGGKTKEVMLPGR